MTTKLWKNQCDVKDCGKRGVFNYDGNKHGIRCRPHMEIDMVDVVNARCKAKGCTTRPAFNFPGEKKGIYCNNHKKPLMKNVTSAYCLEQGCEKQASFGLPGTKKPLYCAEHAPDDHTDVAHRKCAVAKCGLIPFFNYPGEKKGIYCQKHSLKGMENVVDRRCAEPGCNTQPVFNLPGEKLGKWCKKHADPAAIDIKNKGCIHEGCGVQASYNIFGHIALYCKKHAPESAIYLPTPKCKGNGCARLATHGSKGSKRPQHCEYHHDLTTEFDMVSIPCKSCNLLSIIDEEGLCYYCNPNNALKYIHAKELKVKEYLDDHDIIYDQHDKVIDGGKLGKERPDFLFKRKTHCVILEVDENQHGERPCECEQTRMVNISQSLGLPTVFIRYNPDNYVKFSKVRKMPNENHNTRMEITVDIINKYLNKLPAAFLSVTQLFFDGWNGEHQLITILDFEDDHNSKITNIIGKVDEADNAGESEEKTNTVKYEKIEQPLPKIPKTRKVKIIVKKRITPIINLPQTVLVRS